MPSSFKNKPSSFDIVGDIIILNKEVKSPKKVVKELLKIHKHVKTVLLKTGNYQGKFRTPKLKVIYGENKKTTVHKENKVILKLNVEKCYFSQRTASERLRIAKQIKPKESILVMFSGTAILPLVIEKNAKPKEITSIELNPIAHKYAEENLKINKSKIITLIKGDVADVLPKIRKRFDRILMPLPKDSLTYLELAKSKLKKQGTIHLYIFGEEKDISLLKKQYKAKKIIKCGQVSPRVYRLCIEINKFI
ncbi:class I SAM-dependent methyltransferase family protein [Candidatus Pacearchaeota archaeon]|nr:class I SAM-dependent methyltransferase family protein [Candidatus Pacearchaeota archaeon]